MGYTGGSLPEPTYHSLGDHSEAIEIGFDPTQISYETLLLEFWTAHAPTSEPWSQQYRSAVFPHDAAQRDAAERVKRITAKRLGARVYTAIEDATTFWPAEAYHQKHRLRQDPVLLADVLAFYPDVDDLVHSTTATRLNAWVAGWGERADVAEVRDKLGLSDAGQARLATLEQGL